MKTKNRAIVRRRIKDRIRLNNFNRMAGPVEIYNYYLRIMGRRMKRLTPSQYGKVYGASKLMFYRGRRRIWPSQEKILEMREKYLAPFLKKDFDAEYPLTPDECFKDEK